MRTNNMSCDSTLQNPEQFLRKFSFGWLSPLSLVCGLIFFPVASSTRCTHYKPQQFLAHIMLFSVSFISQRSSPLSQVYGAFASLPRSAAFATAPNVNPSSHGDFFALAMVSADKKRWW
jgi:hypothetical protein